MKILESCIRFLDSYNFFVTRIPRCILQCPERVVELGIMHPDVCAGISLGRSRVGVPDILLGFVDIRGRWHWASTYCSINLHSKVPATATFPDVPAWPVWLTITDLPSRKRLAHGPPSIDMLAILARYTRARFWDAAFEEFIRTTWHPTRLHWCLDTDDHDDFFEPKKNDTVYHVHGNHHPRRGKLLA